jgi:hypothetical protein
MAGFAISVVSLLVAFGYLIAKLLFWDDLQLGLAPLLIGIYFFGAVQLFFIGMLGEYIGAISTQVHKRPLVVEKERTPTSTTDDLVRLLPGAKVVKCFNTIGAENFATARRRAAPAVMFAAGDDPDAKRIALELATEIGFRAEDAGGLANAKPLEEMVKIWLALTAQHGRGLGSPCPTGKRPSGAPPWRGGSGRRGDLSRGAGIPEAGRGGADRRDVDVAPLRDAWPTRRDRSRPTKGASCWNSREMGHAAPPRQRADQSD